MTNEQLRMQMLAGIITEGEYKAKLEETRSLMKNASKEARARDVEQSDLEYTATRQKRDKMAEKMFNKTYRECDERQKDKVRNQLEKSSLNENFVGIGAINSPFAKRKKESYEDAFEHFLSERYEVKPNREQDLEEGEGKEELVGKIKNLGDFGLTGDEIEFNGLLITSSTQEDEGGPYYFVYGEDDDSEDGIFQSTDPNEIAEFVLNY
jgi:hypothetical protein